MSLMNNFRSEVMKMKIGYARISTPDQSFDLQVGALEKLGAKKSTKRSQVEQKQRDLCCLRNSYETYVLRMS